MKFYKAKHAEVGEGVEATVIFHKDSGDELLCVRSGWDSFEKQNPKAKECSIEAADKSLKTAKLKLAIPKKKERRKKGKHLTDEDILKEIEDKKTPTINILKSENEEDQTLTYVEDVEITSTEEFFKAQEAQVAELETEEIEENIEEEPQETTI